MEKSSGYVIMMNRFEFSAFNRGQARNCFFSHFIFHATRICDNTPVLFKSQRPMSSSSRSRSQRIISCWRVQSEALAILGSIWPGGSEQHSKSSQERGTSCFPGYHGRMVLHMRL